MVAQYTVAGPAILNREVMSLDPSQLPEAIFKRDHARLCLRIVGDKTHQHADPPHPLGLRPRRERPRRRRAADEGDELAAVHSIASSTLASSCGGTSMPSALAVCRLMTNWNFVDCSTGRSAGFAPLRI